MTTTTSFIPKGREVNGANSTCCICAPNHYVLDVVAFLSPLLMPFGASTNLGSSRDNCTYVVVVDQTHYAINVCCTSYSKACEMRERAICLLFLRNPKARGKEKRQEILGGILN